MNVQIAESSNNGIIDFIGDRVVFDEDGAGFFWGDKNGTLHEIADIRAWPEIQKLFNTSDDSIDFERASNFQYRLSHFIAEAINEKIRKEKS